MHAFTVLTLIAFTIVALLVFFNSEPTYLLLRSMSWFEGRSKCRQAGGDLMSLTSAEEENLFVDYLKQNQIDAA